MKMYVFAISVAFNFSLSSKFKLPYEHDQPRDIAW